MPIATNFVPSLVPLPSMTAASSPEMVVVEAIFFIPKSILFASDAVHGIHDEDEVLKELGGHVFVDSVVVDSQL